MNTNSDPSTSSTSLPKTNTEHNGGLSGKAKTGAIVGGVVGGVAVLVFLVWLIVCIRKRRSARVNETVSKDPVLDSPQTQMQEPVVNAFQGLITKPEHRTVENEN